MLKKSAIEGLRGFLKHAETLKPPNNLQRENGFAKEFQEIKEASSRRKKDPKYSTHHGEKDVNRPKNRYKDIMPYDYSRIILPGIEGKEGSDYINGNYIKGPTEEVVYLAAQGPLPSTVNDFWRMILSHQTQVIVMACREYELGKLKCKRYWPEKPDEKLTFDSCVVSLISQEEMGDGFVIRTLSAKDENGELKVTQFHYTAWPDHDVPRSATPLIELTMSFRAFVGNDNNVPVVVHCSAGCGRTGTICALDYALSLIKLGRTDNFSVFDIVSTLRRQRIAMVQTKEQYELVYKAVKEIVSDELLKQRTSMHTYVNVSVGEEMPEGENTYENVEFIRSIQRLHEEEKNAARKPKELPSKGIVVAPKKDVVLAPQKNVPQRSQPDVPQNRLQDKYTSNHIQGSLPAKQKPEQPGNVSKDNLQQPTTKPPIKKKPQSGYENVLPLSMANHASKPTIEPKPQNYVNVAIGNQKTNTKEDDYVNIPPPVTKSVPVPDKGEHSKKASKPVLAAHPLPTKPLPPHPGYQKMASLNGDGKDYVIPPPYLKEEEKTSDYVIIPSVPAPAKPVEEGNLLDLSDSGPSSLPILQQTYQSDQEVPLDKKIKTLDPLSMTDLSRSSPSLQTKDPDHHPRKQSRTSGGLAISGQYSLVGVSDSGSPNQSDVKDPFENVPKMKGNVPAPKGRSSLDRTVESVVADSAPVKLEKPAVAPRRLSEALLKSFVNQTTVVEKGDVTHTLPKGKAVLGTYSMLDLPNSNSQSNVKSDSLIDLTDETTRDSSQNIPHCRVKKSHSTDNIISSKPDLYSSLQTSKDASTGSFTKQQSFDASDSNYSTVSAPLTRRRSEDILSSPKSGIYSSADREAPVKVALDLSVEERKESGDVLGSGYVRKKPVGVRRSNSGVTAPSADFSLRGEVDNLYATVGAKSRDKRRPLAVDIRWSNDDSPVSSLERPMNRSSNSSSSLRSFNSTSSNDSLEDAPPVPSKTADTYLYPDDEDAYDNVQKSSQKSTLNRIKNKAKNMMHSGPHGPKISLGRKNAASTDSLASGEGQDSYTSHKGYGTHIGKPQGPRQCPNHWPKFKK